MCIYFFNLMYREDKLRINTYMIFLKKITIIILEGREEFWWVDSSDSLDKTDIKRLNWLCLGVGLLKNFVAIQYLLFWMIIVYYNIFWKLLIKIFFIYSYWNLPSHTRLLTYPLFTSIIFVIYIYYSYIYTINTKHINT